MNTHSQTLLHRFCWFDLAAADAGRAAVFYRALLGWRGNGREVAGGRIGEFLLEDAVIASFYQLSQRHLADGVPSHWTPYVSVRSVDHAARRAAELGGAVVVEPFGVPGIARIALAEDPTGAVFGLFEPTAATSR